MVFSANDLKSKLNEKIAPTVKEIEREIDDCLIKNDRLCWYEAEFVNGMGCVITSARTFLGNELLTHSETERQAIREKIVHDYQENGWSADWHQTIITHEEDHDTFDYLLHRLRHASTELEIHTYVLTIKLNK